jgi:predicted nucleic acid-binding protein
VKVLFDTNVVLDVLLARPPYADVAARLLSLVDIGKVEGILCATTVTTTHYIAEKTIGADLARKYVGELLTIFDVACVDRQVLLNALDVPFDVFEDAVLHEAARDAGVTAIVTRNSKDFRRATLPVFDPNELLAAIVAAAE